MDDFEITEKNRIRRSPARGTYDRQVTYDILDAGFVCYAGFIDKGHPVVIPMSYGRKDDTVYLHGATTSRIMNLLSVNNAVCINVTLLDGIVVARSMFDTSVNYRSVVIFGKAETTEETEKMDALHAISEHILPGRWAEVRTPLPNELKATVILKVKIENASAKVRTGPPDDDIRDLDLPVWAGVIPLKSNAGAPVNDPAMRNSLPVPPSVVSAVAKYSGISADPRTMQSI
jgi:nitroimidazol reductase NimA-like FMN-containing flavoprotein (pyridoxamine 5'-phosphate oxidase superfamily)